MALKKLFLYDGRRYGFHSAFTHGLNYSTDEKVYTQQSSVLSEPANDDCIGFTKHKKNSSEVNLWDLRSSMTK